MSRIIGVDYGQRRIGLAVSDPLGILAQPLPTIVRRRGKRPPYSDLVRIVQEWDASALVVGLPLTPDGDESDWTAEVREFGDGLARRTGLPLHYIDERMTTVRAERAVRGSGLSRSKREQKGRIDAAAAMLILQAHLDRSGRNDE